MTAREHRCLVSTLQGKMEKADHRFQYKVDLPNHDHPTKLSSEAKILRYVLQQLEAGESPPPSPREQAAEQPMPVQPAVKIPDPPSGVPLGAPCKVPLDVASRREKYEEKKRYNEAVYARLWMPSVATWYLPLPVWKEVSEPAEEPSPAAKSKPAAVEEDEASDAHDATDSLDDLYGDAEGIEEEEKDEWEIELDDTLAQIKADEAAADAAAEAFYNEPEWEDVAQINVGPFTAAGDPVFQFGVPDAKQGFERICQEICSSLGVSAPTVASVTNAPVLGSEA